MVRKSKDIYQYVAYRDSAPNTPIKPEIPGILNREMVKAVIRDSSPQMRQSSQFHQITDNLFRHCLHQCLLASKAGDTREEWHVFLYLLKRAEQQAMGEINQKTLESLFLLGQLSGQLSREIPDENDQHRKLYEADLARRLPLIERNSRKMVCKDFVQKIAEYKWQEDKGESIRIGEMCDEIWSEVIAGPWRGDLPNSAKGLRSWLRPVAPDYAKKGGRPSEK